MLEFRNGIHNVETDTMRLKMDSSRARGLWTLIAGILLLFPALAGCEGGGSSPPKVLHGCELLTIAEIEAMVGAAVETPPRETHKEDDEKAFWMSMCSYYSPDPGISLGIMIQPLSPSTSPADAHAAYVASLESNMPESQMSPVEGIGRKAVWNGETGQLTIFGDHHMVLVTSMQKDGKGEEKLALAGKAGARVLEKMQ